MNELESCPFCGSTSFIYDINDEGVAVECNGCFAHGPRAKGAYEAEQKWNGRVANGKKDNH